jgi:hypothetical protein
MGSESSSVDNIVVSITPFSFSDGRTTSLSLITGRVNMGITFFDKNPTNPSEDSSCNTVDMIKLKSKSLGHNSARETLLPIEVDEVNNGWRHIYFVAVATAGNHSNGTRNKFFLQRMCRTSKTTSTLCGRVISYQRCLLFVKIYIQQCIHQS